MKHYVNIAHSEKENLEGDPRNTDGVFCFEHYQSRNQMFKSFPQKNSNCSLFADPTP